jgi:DNA-directed RNA polymerase subunit omega
MDPNIVFDCEKVLPNKFGLAIAAAARVRALGGGGEPRIRIAGAGRTELALREIAAGAFKPDELAPFVCGPEEVKLLASSDPSIELRGDSASGAAATTLSRPRKRAH